MSAQEESTNSDTSSDSSSTRHRLVVALAAGLGAYVATRSTPGPVVNPPPPILPRTTGRQWVELNLRDSRMCYVNFRMQPDDFLFLHHILVTHHGLQSTQQFESIEGLAMFLWACATHQPTRQIRVRFDRSLDTISRKMAEVTDAVFSFAQTIIGPKDPTYALAHPRLLRYAPFFDGCIGALDGTHIPVQVSHEARLDFINRKGYTSFNVLGIVDFDMRFTYVGAGRAGSCHDMAVLRDCMETPNYPHPPPGM